MDELRESTPDLASEIRSLHQAIGQLCTILTAKSETPQPAVMRPKSAAAYLSTTLGGLQHLLKKGGIPYRRQGRNHIFLKAELDAWLAALPGITVEAALKTIKPEHSTVYVQHSITVRQAEPAPPHDYMPLKRGPKGTNRLRMQSKARNEATN